MFVLNSARGAKLQHLHGVGGPFLVGSPLPSDAEVSPNQVGPPPSAARASSPPGVVALCFVNAPWRVVLESCNPQVHECTPI